MDPVTVSGGARVGQDDRRDSPESRVPGAIVALPGAWFREDLTPSASSRRPPAGGGATHLILPRRDCGIQGCCMA